MRIVLDSSVIVEGDWNLEHNAAQALLGACGRGEIELCVPRVVLDEVRNAYEEREASKLDALNDARARLRSMRGPRAGAGEFEGKVTAQAGYFAYLRRAITEVGGRILEYPDIGHQELLERSLQRRAPFDSSRQRGYRDALIWHNVIELAGSGRPVVFATNDGDFRESKDSNGLHPHLASDLSQRSIAAERVTLAHSLGEVVEQVIKPAAGVRKALGSELGNKATVRRELEVAMAKAAKRGAFLDVSHLDVVVDPSLEAFSAEVIEKRFREISSPARLAIAEVVPLGSEKFGVEAWLEGTASIELTVLIDGFSAKTDAPPGLKVSADGQSASVLGSAEVRLIFEIDYDQREERLGIPTLIEIRGVVDGDGKGSAPGSTAAADMAIEWFQFVQEDEAEIAQGDEDEMANEGETDR